MATDIPGTRDLIEHAKTGYLYPPADLGALTRSTVALLQDDRLRTQMGEQARLRAIQHFSLEQMVQSHEQLYLRLLDGR